jgi:hypothetical protein
MDNKELEVKLRQTVEGLKGLLNMLEDTKSKVARNEKRISELERQNLKLKIELANLRRK